MLLLALRIRKLNFGDEDQFVADTLQWMGNVFREWNDSDEAMTYFEEAYRIKRKMLGETHLEVAEAMVSHAFYVIDGHMLPFTTISTVSPAQHRNCLR